MLDVIIWVHYGFMIFLKGDNLTRYILHCLLVVRRACLHLELQPSLVAAPCIRAMKRTFARVGYPKRLISDNYKTFRSEKLRTFATTRSIDWRYILELSPHWGRFSECLNRMIKRALRKTLWKAKLSYEEVETILIEIEGSFKLKPPMLCIR